MSPKLPRIRPHPSESVQPPGRETTQCGTTSYSVLSSRPTKCLYPTPHSPPYPSIFYIILYNYTSLTRYSYVLGRTWGQSSIIGSKTKGLCVSDPPRRVGRGRTGSDSTVTGRTGPYGAGCDDTGPGATIRGRVRRYGAPPGVILQNGSPHGGIPAGWKSGHVRQPAPTRVGLSSARVA